MICSEWEWHARASSYVLRYMMGGFGRRGDKIQKCKARKTQHLAFNNEEVYRVEGRKPNNSTINSTRDGVKSY